MEEWDISKVRESALISRSRKHGAKQTNYFQKRSKQSTKNLESLSISSELCTQGNRGKHQANFNRLNNKNRSRYDLKFVLLNIYEQHAPPKFAGVAANFKQIALSWGH